jgi:capsular polysaccharide biosynthesis protein
VLTHPLLTLLPIVLLVGAAVFVGKTRDPEYTAEARLVVGSLSPAVAAQTPSTDANQQLAATYARGISGAPVVKAVSRRTGIPEQQVRARLGASQVPSSPVFWIKGRATNERDAVTLTRVATDAMRTWATSVSSDDSAAGLLKRYRDAQLKVAQAERQVTRSELVGGSAAREAKADYETAALEANALKSDYLEQAGRSGGQPVRTVNTADHATSDASKQLRLYVVGAALMGVVLGVALATAVAASRHRRRRKALPAF